MSEPLYSVGQARRDGTTGVAVRIIAVLEQAHASTGQRLYLVSPVNRPDKRRRIQESFLAREA